MSENESEHNSPEPERPAVRVPTQDVNQTENEDQEDVDEDQDIIFNVYTSTDMILQEENIADANRYEINPHGSKTKIISSSEVGNSTATGETQVAFSLTTIGLVAMVRYVKTVISRSRLVFQYISM